MTPQRLIVLIVWYDDDSIEYNYTLRHYTIVWRLSGEKHEDVMRLRRQPITVLLSLERLAEGATPSSTSVKAFVSKTTALHTEQCQE